MSQTSSVRERRAGLSGSEKSFGSTAPGLVPQLKKTFRASTKDSPRRRRNAAHQAICATRTLFLLILWLVAAALGVLAFKLMASHEQTLAERQFQSLAQRALLEAKRTLEARRWAAVSMSQSVAALYPNANTWPFVEWWGYEAIARSMLETGGGQALYFLPIVRPEQKEEYDAYALEVYQQLGFAAPYEGIWKIDESTLAPVPDQTGETNYNSPHQLLAPIFRTEVGADPNLLFNSHSFATYGRNLDKMFECSSRKNLNQTKQEQSCGVITGLFQSPKLDRKWTAAHGIPIFPENDPHTVRILQQLLLASILMLIALTLFRLRDIYSRSSDPFRPSSPSTNY